MYYGRCVGSCLCLKLPQNIRGFPTRNEKKSKMQSVKFQPVDLWMHQPNFTFVLGSSTSKKRPTYVPWKSILTAPCVWAIILVHGASVFGYFLVVNQLPGYMKEILKYDIKSNGLLSSLPYFGKYTMSVCASHFADHLRSTGKISTTAARKGFTTFAVAPPGIAFIFLIFFGYDKVWAVTIFTIALTLNGAVTAGYLGNGLDIAPNFSGTIFGMANTLSSLGGFISAWMVGQLTENNVSFKTNHHKLDALLILNLSLEHLRSMANYFRNRCRNLPHWKFVILNNGHRRVAAMEQSTGKERPTASRYAGGRRRSSQEKQCIVNQLIFKVLEKFISSRFIEE